MMYDLIQWILHETEQILRCTQNDKYPKRVVLLLHFQKDTIRWSSWLSEVSSRMGKHSRMVICSTFLVKELRLRSSMLLQGKTLSLRQAQTAPLQKELVFSSWQESHSMNRLLAIDRSWWTLRVRSCRHSRIFGMGRWERWGGSREQESKYTATVCSNQRGIFLFSP